MSSAGWFEFHFAGAFPPCGYENQQLAETKINLG